LQKLKPYKIVLENGMVIILAENHNAPVVSMQIFVKVGSVYEGKYLGTGISHFVEHVVDDGTHRRSRQTIDELVEYIGNISNAYTCKDHTKYYITTSIADFDIALDVISDYLQNAIFPASEVEIQRGVILNEFNQDADEPYRQLNDLYYETAYQKHPVRYPVGGYRHLFEKLKRNDLVDFYTQTYVPENMIFVAVGDFGIQETLDKIKSAFKDFTGRPVRRDFLPQETKQLDIRRVQQYADVEITYMLVGFHTSDIFNEDTYALDVISAILGDGSHSRMNIAIKNQKKLVYSIDVWSEVSTYNVGLFMIEAELEAVCLELSEDAILQELYQLKTEPVSDKELQRAKAMEESAHIFSLQTAEECASILGMNELMTADINFSEKYLQKFKAVTATDIMRVAKKYFNPENMTVAMVMPRTGIRNSEFGMRNEKIAEHFPVSSIPEFPDSQVPAKLDQRDFSGTDFIIARRELLKNCVNYQETYTNCAFDESAIREIGNSRRNGEYSSPLIPHSAFRIPHSSPHSPQKVELDNGIRLLVGENHFMPIVSIQAMFLGGVFCETEDNNGICNFMANMLIKGAEQRTALQITEQLEAIGGAIDVFSGNHSFGCVLNLLSRDFELGLDILSDVIQVPTFEVEEIEIQRREIIAEIKATDDDLMSSAQKLFLGAMFPQTPNAKPHPYSFQPMGTLDTISLFEREEVIDFYQEHCISNNMVLAIFGDINSNEVIDGASTYFSDMPKGDNLRHSIASPALNCPYSLNDSLTGVRRVEKIQDVSQSLLFIGYPGITLFHDDKSAMQVMDGILSGIGYPGGRLHKRLRHDKHVYLIHAYNLFGLDTGYFAIYSSTTAEMLEAVLSVIDEEIEDLRESEVSVQELERGKRMCVSNHRLSMQTVSEQAFSVSIDELYGLGYDYSLHYEAEINSVTSEDIKRVANQYLNSDRRVISIVSYPFPNLDQKKA